jgi:hypothetical protein
MISKDKEIFGGSSSLKLVESKTRPKIINLSLNESPLKKVFVQNFSQNSSRNAILANTNTVRSPNSSSTTRINVVPPENVFLAPPHNTIVFRPKSKKLQ